MGLDIFGDLEPYYRGNPIIVYSIKAGVALGLLAVLYYFDRVLYAVPFGGSIVNIIGLVILGFVAYYSLEAGRHTIR